MSGDIGGDVFDVRDVMSRYEELESERESLADAATDAQEALADLDEDEPESERNAAQDDLDAANAALTEWDAENGEELKDLGEFLDEVKGCGGDEQWRGSWYPITFVRDSYFTEFAQEEAEQLGMVESDVKWPYTCIDWDKAAEELQQDYSTVEFQGSTYHYRSG